MKKILLSALIIAASYQLKAQELTLKPIDTTLFKIPKGLDLQSFNLNDSNLLKGLSVLPKLNQIENLKKYPLNSSVFSSTMPVAELIGYDRMPVVKLDGLSKMPVKKIVIIDPLSIPQKGLIAP